MEAGPVLIIVMVVFGCVSFVVGVLYLVFRVFVGVFGTIARVFQRLLGFGSPRAPVRAGRARMCSCSGCRKVEHREATYCSRCGHRLD